MLRRPMFQSRIGGIVAIGGRDGEDGIGDGSDRTGVPGSLLGYTAYKVWYGPRIANIASGDSDGDSNVFLTEASRFSMSPTPG
jgi:hypothetical protein